MTADQIDHAISAAIAAIPVILVVLTQAMAILPQGTPGSVWDTIRTVVNYLAGNYGHAKNKVEHE